MPRTFGRNQIHVSQVVGWMRGRLPTGRGATGAADATSTTASPRSSPSGSPTAPRSRSASASIPNAILVGPRRPSRPRHPHRADLSDGVMDLVERGVVNGVAKQLNRTKTVGTFALGTRRAVRLPRREHGVRAVAGPLRQRPARDRPGVRTSCRSTRRSPSTCSASAPPRPSPAPTTRRAAARPTSPAARCTPPAARASSCCTRRREDGTISKIVPQLAAGDVVTTLKNTVDKVVTEWGVAELRGRSIRERADGADRHRPPRPPRPPAVRSRRTGLLLTSPRLPPWLKESPGLRAFAGSCARSSPSAATSISPRRSSASSNRPPSFPTPGTARSG